MAGRYRGRQVASRTPRMNSCWPSACRPSLIDLIRMCAPEPREWPPPRSRRLLIAVCHRVPPCGNGGCRRALSGRPASTNRPPFALLGSFGSVSFQEARMVRRNASCIAVLAREQPCAGSAGEVAWGPGAWRRLNGTGEKAHAHRVSGELVRGADPRRRRHAHRGAAHRAVYRCNIWLVHGRERRRRREAAVRRQARNLADELGNEDYHEAFVRDGTRRC